jgi:hypothetical protein
MIFIEGLQQSLPEFMVVYRDRMPGRIDLSEVRVLQFLFGKPADIFGPLPPSGEVSCH